jgi:hypothetical protein
MISYQLSRPFAFAWILADGLNRIRYILPAAITAAGFTIYFLVLDFGFVISPRKLAHVSADAIVLLPGFYIAALAAVSSFNSVYLDQQIAGSGAKLRLLTQGKMSEVDLTYRMYVCYIFAYLTVLSVVLYAALSLSTDVSDAFGRLVSENTAAVLDWLGSLILTFWTVNLAVVTLHGLYFLAERMHRPYA